MKLRLILLVAVVFILVLAACVPEVQPLRDETLLPNPAILSGEPCEPPCWNNIIPGETSWDAAFTILEDDTDMREIQQLDAEESDVRALVWQYRDGRSCCQIISTEDGQGISSILLFTTPDVTLGAVIDLYGDPAYIGGVDVSPDQAMVALLFPDVPMIVYAFVAGAETGTLSASSEVIGVTYTNAETMQLFLVSNDLYVWDGYGSFADFFEGSPDITAEPTGSDSSESGDDAVDSEATAAATESSE